MHRRLALSCALSLVASAARAQSATDGATPEATPLPPVEVPLPPVEATPSSPTRRDPTAAVTVIDVAAREKSGPTDAATLAADAPGVTLQDAGGAGQRKSLSLRGSASNAVLVLLDGVPLASPGTAFDLSRVPTAALERIEVLRGVGARYGPGGMGGVINLVTRAPDGTRAFGALSQGSFQTTTGTVGGSARLGQGEGLLLLSGLRSEGDFRFTYDDRPALDGNPLVTLTRQNNQAAQGGGVARYRLPALGGTLDLTAQGLMESRGLAGTVQNPTADAHQDSRWGVLSSRLGVPLEGGGELSVLAFGRADATTLSGSPFGARPYPQLERSLGVEVTATRLVAARHGLTALATAGGDWLTEPSGRNPWQGRLGVFLADDVLFHGGDLVVSPSARVDLAGPFVVVSPKLGASLTLPHGFELKVNAGQTSRAPSFVERYVQQGSLVPNPDLRPERTLGADATVAYGSPRAALALTGFGGLSEDLISYEYYPPTRARPYNFSAALVTGVEVEARVTPFRWLDAQAAYTFLRTQNLRDDPRYYLKALPFRPAHRLSARVTVGPSWLLGRAELLAQSEQFQNRTEKLVLPARAFVNVGLSSSPPPFPAVTVSLEVKNLLDAQSQDVDGYPLPPRAAYLTLAVAWDAALRKAP